MTALLTPPPVSGRAPLPVPPVPPKTAAGWLVGPWFDLFFLANAGWPLLVAALLAWGPELQAGVSFWQIYFVSTPHRFITLPLVFCDRARFQERPGAFLLVGGVIVATCLGFRAVTGSITCFLFVDLIWNSWHFASQHAGLFRFYSRQAGAPPAGAQREKLLFRVFVLYVMLRSAGLAWTLLGQPLSAAGAFAGDPFHTRFQALLDVTDLLSLAAAAALVVSARPKFSPAHLGRTIYLLSVVCLYVAMLGVVRSQRLDWLLVLNVVGGLFHATEYLAIVSVAVHKRHGEPEVLLHAETGSTAAEGWIRPPQRTLFARLLPHWTLTLAVFCGALGLASWITYGVAIELWLFVNVVVSFLHYAYDGMIWKTRPGRAAT